MEFNSRFNVGFYGDSNGHVRNLIDALGLTDSLIRIFGLSFVDGLGMLDSPVQVTNYLRSFGPDALSLTDIVNIHPVRQLTDALGITDTRIQVQHHVRDVVGLVGTF